jgi:hypothetical protein
MRGRRKVGALCGFSDSLPARKSARGEIKTSRVTLSPYGVAQNGLGIPHLLTSRLRALNRLTEFRRLSVVIRISLH